MPTVETSKVSKSGITTSETGERHIPASTRADGSVRKEIRVRPGYRPPEDVEVYKNRTAEAWKNRGSGGVPGAEGLKDDNIPAKSSPSNKNAKRRENRKKAAAAAAEKGTASGEKNENATESKDAPVTEPPKPADPEAEKEKEAKKLLKKLRQARELKDKKEKGDKLLPEQFEKVIKINELIRQLEGLGFHANGEKKTEETGT
jgi:partner of Y14 and mago